MSRIFLFEKTKKKQEEEEEEAFDGYFEKKEE